MNFLFAFEKQGWIPSWVCTPFSSLSLPGTNNFFFSILFLLFLEDKDSDGKEKKSKSKENDKKKEPASMFVINGDKEPKSKKKGSYLSYFNDLFYLTSNRIATYFNPSGIQSVWLPKK